MSSVYISEAARQHVAEVAQYRCGYCLSAQKYVMDQLEIEHIIPRAVGGSSEESNLWLACGLCNGFKGIQVICFDPETSDEVSLFNPRTQSWLEHFRWDETGAYITGLTPVGRATVVALQLNNEIAITVRRNWVTAGWHPPQDTL